MNPNLQTDLLRDQLLSSVARRRRRHQLPYLGATAALLLALFFFLSASPQSQPQPLGETEPVAPDYQTITTEEELMDTLAHLGPIIVTKEDGSRWLYLTNQ